MNTRLTVERQQEKICLIEDIIKAQRLAYGMGLGYRTVISDPTAIFDQLYDMDAADLKGIFKTIQHEISAKARLIAGIDHE